MANLMDTIAETIKEEIDQGIDESLPKLDPVATQAVPTSAGVYRTGIGRDWKVKHTFSGSISGSFAWRNATGGTVAIDGSDGANSFSLFGTDALETWQGVNEISSAGFIQKELQLKEGFGNFLLPLKLLRSDRLDASVGSVVSEIVKGAAKRVALSQVHSFWKEDSDNNIGAFTAAGEVLNTTAKEFTLTAGRIRSFFPGLAVQIFKSDGSAPTGMDASEPVWVDDVDYLKKSIKLVRRSGASNVTLPSASVLILPYDGATSNADNSVAPSGLNDWIKDGTETDTNVFGIDVTAYSQFRSIKASPGGVPDTSVLNKHISGFNDAYGAELDTILLAEGMMLAIVDNIADNTNFVRYDLQNENLAVKQGFQPINYMYNGKLYRIMTSPNCPNATVYVVKLKDQNLRKYVPPKLQGAGSESRFNGSVEFAAPVMGSRNIFLPVTSNDKPANFMQAPHLAWCEYCPKMVQSIKLDGFTDTSIYTG